MADQTQDQKPDFLSRMKDFLFAHKALQEAAGQALPHPAGWMPDQDTSGVAKAAAEAGARMEAEKKAKAAQGGANRVAGPDKY